MNVENSDHETLTRIKGNRSWYVFLIQPVLEAAMNEKKELICDMVKVVGDQAREAMGLKFRQAEYEELRLLEERSKTQVLTSKEADRLFNLMQRKRQLG